MYTFDGFSKATVVGWLNAVRAAHGPGLTDLRLQYLEDQRDLTDWRDYPRFKELTTEICTYVGQPFEGDAIETDVLPQGEVLHRWIDSIIRTRHKFFGQPRLGKHGMMNRYTVNYPESLVYNHEHHIATIMMIDAMAKLAIVDDEFYDAWAGVTEDAPVSEAFIKQVLDTLEQDAYGETKPGIWRVKAVTRTILQKNPALVRLAGDIFSLYAPKMDLKKVYNELMVSGGTYRGWEISGLDSFAHVINLTEGEKAANPELETELRLAFNRKIPISTSVFDVYPTSTRSAVVAFLNNNSHSIFTIKYIFNGFLRDRINSAVTTLQSVYFTLTKNLRSKLIHLASKNAITDEAVIYKLNRDTISQNSSYYGVQRGIGFMLNNHATELVYGLNENDINIPKAIDLYREAFFLGLESAKINLTEALNNYSMEIISEENGVAKDILQAIELLREATALGCEPAKNNLTIVLNDYAIELANEVSGIEVKLPKAIGLLREAINLGLVSSKIILAQALDKYAAKLANGRNGFERNLPKATELLMEAVSLGYEDAKIDLAITLSNHAIELANGRNGFNKNLPKAIRLLKEAIDLGHERAKNILAAMLSDYAYDFVKGTEGCIKNLQRAIELLKESVLLGSPEAQAHLDYVIDLYENSVD